MRFRVRECFVLLCVPPCVRAVYPFAPRSEHRRPPPNCTTRSTFVATSTVVTISSSIATNLRCVARPVPRVSGSCHNRPLREHNERPRVGALAAAVERAGRPLGAGALERRAARRCPPAPAAATPAAAPAAAAAAARVRGRWRGLRARASQRRRVRCWRASSDAAAGLAHDAPARNRGRRRLSPLAAARAAARRWIARTSASGGPRVRASGRVHRRRVHGHACLTRRAVACARHG